MHVVGPEQGFSLPGPTIVCGDRHTSCHGGLGALAFGIGTSEVEHVLATQTLLLKQSKTMEIRVDGELGRGVTPKDVILHIIGVIGAAGGTGQLAVQLAKLAGCTVIGTCSSAEKAETLRSLGAGRGHTQCTPHTVHFPSGHC